MNSLPVPLQQVDRTYVRYLGQRLSYFSGCDYYRLASHPAVRQAARRALDRDGLNVAASRLTTGNHSLYETLEKRLAEFFRAETAVLFSSGYVANLGLAQALAGRFSQALIDERAHVSLLEAAQRLQCPIVRFQHRDPDAVLRILKRIHRLARPLLLTDGLFAHDGSVAPLDAYLAVLPKTGRIWVDEAHASGVLGQSGRGTLEHLGLPPARIFRTVTLSKAFGVYGGAVLGPRIVRQRIHARSGVFVGNTPLPLPLVAAALQALATLASSPGLRTRLHANTAYVKGKLRDAGFPAPPTPGPIIPLIPRGKRDVARISELLLKRRIYPPFIVYPGGPATGYFRFALSSEHQRSQLDQLLGTLTACWQAGWAK